MREDNILYEEDIRAAAQAPLPWEVLEGKNILAAGATGLLGTALTDVLMYKNKENGLRCHIYTTGRDFGKAERRFRKEYFSDPYFHFLEWNIVDPPPIMPVHMDYILGMASNTHPLAYSQRPIETIITNIYGTKNLLDLCRRQGEGRVIFLSSVEIYGENRRDKELFDEGYTGLLNPNTLRAGYPESKRCGESLCRAYQEEAGVDYVAVRLPRLFGPALLEEDSKAVSQFIHNALEHKDIVLKSDGNQRYSFLYVIDAVTGLLTALLLGVSGEAYNIASGDNDATLKEMAETAALAAGRKVIYERPEENEKAGYSTATVAKLDGTKIKHLGWKPIYNSTDALLRTIHIMESNNRPEGGKR